MSAGQQEKDILEYVDLDLADQGANRKGNSTKKAGSGAGKLNKSGNGGGSSNRIVIILCAVFLLCAVVAGVVFAVQAAKRNRAEQQYQQLAADTEVTEKSLEPTESV